jgi:ABC-type bacteriocin/lantibiotic exporter with double-glycine peptidase domain
VHAHPSHAGKATSEDVSLRKAQQALARLLELLRSEKQGIYVVVVYAVGIGLASLAAPLGVQMLVSAIAFGGLVQPVIVLSLCVLVALTFAAVLQGMQVWVVERIQQRLFVRVSADLSMRLSRARLTCFDDAHGPELVNRFFDVMTLQKGAAMLLLDGIFVALQVIVGGLLLALYHPALLGFAAALLIAVLIVMFSLARRGAATSITESKAKYALVAWFEEMARHPTIFRSESAARFGVTQGDALTRDYVAARKAHFRILFRQTTAFLALQAIATASLLGLGGFLVLRGQLTLGQLVAAELILTSLVAGFAKFGKYLESYYDLIAATDKLGGLIELPLENGSHGPLPDVKGPLGISLCSVEYTYPNGGRGVAPLLLDVPAGSRVAVVGPNGSGKSTLLDLIYGAREPARGHVEVDGLPLRELPLPAYREAVVLVRRAAVFDGTLLENLSMGRSDVPLHEVRVALESVGLWDEVMSLPEGLDTPVTTNGGNLSAGQAQRLAIARAILGRPRCLLLDEALDDIDPELRRRILGRVLGPEAPWTVIVATHDTAVANACSHSFDIGRGQLRALTASEGTS